MNKKSLEKELKRLKTYLKTTKEKNEISIEESKIISHTIVGMIMSIHNLIQTGAYDQNDNSNKELFELIKQARHSAIHYGYFDDFSNIKSTASKIASKIPDSLSNNFANLIPNMTFNEDDIYYQLDSTSTSEIKEDVCLPEFFSFKNLHSKETIYIKKEDLLIVENELNHTYSYLVKDSDNKNIFYKKSPDSESEMISFNDFYLLPMAKGFKITSKGNKFSKVVNKILNELKQNSYDNLIVYYKYNNKTTYLTAHSILKDILYNRSIKERILNDNFGLSKYPSIEKNSDLDFSSLQIKDMANAASLSDIFYMELYLKKYRLYQNLKEDLKEKDVEISTYAKQSILINLFENGASCFSPKFLESDKSKNFLKFYYNFKEARNNLAHLAITNPNDKQTLIDNIEEYSDNLYQILEEVYTAYTRQKAKVPYSNFPPAHKLDSTHLIINNKTSRFINVEHNGICKIIDGKKYLKLNVIPNHTYVEVDGTILSVNYNTLISKRCLVSLDHARFVSIDPNTNEISTSKYNPNNEQIIHIDPYGETLLQAHDLFKSYPQYKKKNSFVAITYFNKNNEPTYTEGIKNLIYRKLSQKVLPSHFIEASSLVVPKDFNEPLQILNKDKTIIAKVYLACINNIGGKEVVKQLLKNEEQKDILYGRLLPKDLKTNEIVVTTNEGRK